MPDKRIQYHNLPPSGEFPTDAPRGAVRDEFARRLQAALNDKGWNQSDLARQATKQLPNGGRVGRDDISNYVRGQNLPTPVKLKAMADALGCRTTDLLPSRGVPHVGAERPRFNVQMLGDGTSWVSINQRVPDAVATKLMALITETNAVSEDE